MTGAFSLLACAGGGPRCAAKHKKAAGRGDSSTDLKLGVFQFVEVGQLTIFLVQVIDQDAARD